MSGLFLKKNGENFKKLMMRADHYKQIDSLIKRSPLVIAGAYLIFSSIWIVYSDSWVLRIYDDPQTITTIQTYKGWAESYDLGANSYIVKPVDFKKFMGSVADVGLYWMLHNRTPKTLKGNNL